MSRSLPARTVALLLGAGACLACTELRSADDPTPAAPGDDAGLLAGELPDGASVDSGSGPGPGSKDGGPGDGGGPGAACRPLLPDCLDPSAANVHEVPTEMSWQAAVAAAKANDTIQLKGLALPAGYRVPPYVTLRGCAGAKLTGNLAFEGSAGVVEGFTVTNTGTIVANITGSYVVRRNRFVGPATGNEPGVSGRSIDGIVEAQVTLAVEGNVFEERSYGLQAATSRDTGARSVTLTARNNVFRGVANPIVISEGGLAGKIEAKIEHSTFAAFGTAIDLVATDRVVKTSGNVFANGTRAVRGTPYEVAYSFAWNVTTPAGSPPLTGTFATADPRFVDLANGDLRPGSGSPLVDAIPSGTPVPAEDVQGCPRPVGPSGEAPRADVGAYENP